MILTFKQLGEIGIVRDMHPSELPDNAWTNGNNVVFRDGIAQRIMGDSTIFDGNTYSPEKIMFYPDPQSGTAYWLYAGYDVTDMRILSWDGANHVDRTSADVGDPYTSHSGWTSGTVAGVPYFNNGTAAPWVWIRAGDGVALDALMVQMSTWPAGMIAEQLRSFRNFYIAMDITESGAARNPSRLMWSHPAEPYAVPSSWDITDTTKLAGDVVLGDTADYLVDCLQLRGNNIVYKRNETWVMRRVPSNDVFAFDRLYKETGLLAPRCAAPIKGTFHFMATNNQDIIVHDGNTKQSVADRKVRNAIFAEISEEGLTRCFTASNKTQEEVWFCYPTSGNDRCNRAAIWNYETTAWSFRDLDQATDMAYGIPTTTSTPTGDDWNTGPDTSWNAGEDIPWSAFYNSILQSSEVMSKQDAFLKIDDTTRFSGSDYTAFLEKRGIDFGMPERRKEIRAIIPEIQGSIARVQVGGANNIEGPYTWTPPKDFDPSKDYKVDTRKNCRYGAMRFESENEFRISSIGVDVVERGKR